MTAEGRTQRAIQITRKVLMTIMNEPVALMRMVVYGVPPDEVEDTIADILAYLEKTAPEAKKAEKANRIETHRKAVAKKWGVEEEEEE